MKKQKTKIFGLLREDIEDILILIPILLISFISGMNIADGMDFSITDTAVNDAVISHYDEIEKFENVESATVGLATATNRINISGNSIPLKATNCATMPAPNYSSANYCYFDNSPNLFIYGHNRANIFGKLKDLEIGSTFTIVMGNQTITYKVTDKFTKSIEELNGDDPAKIGLRVSIYKGYYRDDSDLTLQTCHGANDSERLYIKAVRV